MLEGGSRLAGAEEGVCVCAGAMSLRCAIASAPLLVWPMVAVCVCVCVCAWDLHFGMCKVVYHHKRVKDSSLRASPNMPTCSPV